MSDDVDHMFEPDMQMKVNKIKVKLNCTVGCLNFT